MAYNEDLAQRVRQALDRHANVTEKKMFGGIAFMLGDAMCCGVIQDDLMARVGPNRYQEALGKLGARPMDFTGKPMAGYVFVDVAGIRTGAALREWIDWCAEFVSTLPPRKRRRRRARRSP